jgi:hypothetical protein
MAAARQKEMNTRRAVVTTITCGRLVSGLLGVGDAPVAADRMASRAERMPPREPPISVARVRPHRATCMMESCNLHETAF